MSELRQRRPRKRLTREESKALTRSRLLESAHALFAAYGYEGTSIDEIARDAGYTRGAFYANFHDKVSIMRELICTGFDKDLAGVSQMTEMGEGSEISDAYGELARGFYENPENTLWMLEFQLAAVRHKELRKDYSRQFDRLRSLVGEVVVSFFVKDRHTDAEQAKVFADVYIAILTGLSLIKILDPKKVPDRLFKDAFLALSEGIPKVLELK